MAHKIRVAISNFATACYRLVAAPLSLSVTYKEARQTYSAHGLTCGFPQTT